jgi:hypothetical protein
MKLYDYVHLLYDDASFRRSRFYFWATGCLTLFEQSIADTLLRFDTFRKGTVEYEVERRGKSGENKLIKEFDVACTSLNNIRLQFKRKLDEIKVLRDGVSCFLGSMLVLGALKVANTLKQLFSASGVMESRQSRILGQNVQLLTYVSIFFLPLAFCIVS